MKERQATVLIPNYNGMKYLPACIEALFKQDTDDFDILVVENGSTDGSAAWLKEHGIPTLYEKENLGFAGGVNAGLRAVKTPYVILLNNDTEADPGFVRALLKAIRRSPRIFAVSAMMVRPDDPGILDDAGDGISLPGWAFQRGTGEPASLFSKADDVFSACGGAAVYRMSALRETGLFDEAHFAYLEDIDLSWRARLLGYFNRYEPSAVVKHYGSATSGSKYNSFKVRLSSRNHIWLLYKNQPDWQLLMNLPFILSGCLVKACFFQRRGLLKDWAAGTAEGLKGLDRVKRVDFSRVPPSRCLAAEWDMILGTVEYACHLIRRGKA